VIKNGENIIMRNSIALSTIILSIILVGCVSAPKPLTEHNSQLTQGNVQMNLVVGKTTKAEVLEKFGSPNITTRDGAGREVWSYQRAAQVAQSSSQSGYWTIIFAGQSSSASGFESSSRMITLIIKFDGSDIVTDFRSRTSNF
jgi:outer membrane protein assembly factor BamE (lipoprotein component of BamABCDE complex)